MCDVERIDDVGADPPTLRDVEVFARAMPAEEAFSATFHLRRRLGCGYAKNLTY